MEFKNESSIENIEHSNSNIRGKRSKLVSFYCIGCNGVHIDYPIKDIIIIDKENLICREKRKEIIKIVQND